MITRRAWCFAILGSPIGSCADPCNIQMDITAGPAIAIVVPRVEKAGIIAVISDAWMPRGKVEEFRALLARAKDISLTLTSGCPPRPTPPA